jgi:tRNA-guanine family transglycosylase
MGANNNLQALVIKQIKPHFCSSELAYYLQQQIEQLNELELTDVIIPTIHNLYYYLQLMQNMRDAIEQNKFDDFVKQFYQLRR